MTTRHSPKLLRFLFAARSEAIVRTTDVTTQKPLRAYSESVQCHYTEAAPSLE